MKLTKEQIELMKKLFEEGKKQMEIVKELNINQSTVNYWLSIRERRIKKVKEYNKNLSKEKKKEIYRNQYPYRKKYFRDRYRKDEEFRNKVKERARLYQRRKREKC
jgi:predicted transcriptional regulator